MLVVEGMKSESQEKLSPFIRKRLTFLRHNLGDQKIGVEIYRTVFKTYILRRKIYLKHIQNQGTPIMIPK